MAVNQVLPTWFTFKMNSFFFLNKINFFRTDRDSCFRCHTSFSAFTRKHHCRACGETFCSTCKYLHFSHYFLYLFQ
jgi:hypothetical protein